MTRRRVTLWLLSSVILTCMSAVLATGVSAPTARAIAAPVLGLSVTVAVFAINFSFVAFQLAPYRSLLSGPSERHITAAAGLLLQSLAPLLGLVDGRVVAGRVGAATIPLLALGALGLLALGVCEASPTRILESKGSQR